MYNRIHERGVIETLTLPELAAAHELGGGVNVGWAAAVGRAPA